MTANVFQSITKYASVQQFEEILFELILDLASQPCAHINVRL